MIAGGGLPGRLRATTPRERVLVLLCAASIAAFVLVRWAVFPAVERYRKARAAIPQRRATIARYETAAQGQGKLDETLEAMAQRLKESERGLLPGENPAAAGAHLQGILKPLAGRPGTRVLSVRSLSPARKGAYAEVAVQMDLQTNTEGLAALLAAVPRHPKILKVRKLTVSSPVYAAAAANRAEVLTVSITVAGLAGVPAGWSPDRSGP